MTEHPDIFKKAAHENYINIPRLEKKVKQICAFSQQISLFMVNIILFKRFFNTFLYKTM